jgi:hypothetical protein
MSPIELIRYAWTFRKLNGRSPTEAEVRRYFETPLVILRFPVKARQRDQQRRAK